ncbi:MAG: radical SAM protein [Candidatus Hodarchaeales archaeon]|jgi:pyruvate-formate lyase-activating enzyme
MRCLLVEQGLLPGRCLTFTHEGKKKCACQVTLRTEKLNYERLIKSAHLSRPEDYFSVYQSGCCHDCLKCHSSEFSKTMNGEWISNAKLAEISEKYLKYVTVQEPRKRATMWHAEDLCYHCGSCVINGKRSESCPQKLSADQIVFSPQGLGPARNIIAFTGGDITCCPDYYADAAQKIKEATNGKLWVLVESNGYALTRKNLEILQEGGVDSYWLDIKAYDNKIYKKLCGSSNKTVLESVSHIVDLDFTLEVLTLYIPGFVESDQHRQIAQLLCEVDESIPITLLAFFPSYKLIDHRSPTFEEMMSSYSAMKERGLKNIRLGNIGVFAKTIEEQQEVITLRKTR